MGDDENTLQTLETEIDSLIGLEAVLRTALMAAQAAESLGDDDASNLLAQAALRTLGNALEVPNPKSKLNPCPPHVVGSIPILKNIPDSAEQQCAICMNEGSPVLGWMKLPCGHLYHPPCARQWLRRQNTCPMCRNVVLEKDVPGAADAQQRTRYNHSHASEAATHRLGQTIANFRSSQADDAEANRAQLLGHLQVCSCVAFYSLCCMC
jgi:hypothetical protein